MNFSSKGLVVPRFLERLTGWPCCVLRSESSSAPKVILPNIPLSGIAHKPLLSYACAIDTYYPVARPGTPP